MESGLNLQMGPLHSICVTLASDLESFAIGNWWEWSRFLGALPDAARKVRAQGALVALRVDGELMGRHLKGFLSGNLTGFVPVFPLFLCSPPPLFSLTYFVLILHPRYPRQEGR